MKVYDDPLQMLRAERPDLLPFEQVRAGAERVGDQLAHGTTIVALKYDGGVLLGGDTRATMGMHIADERKNKVFELDDRTAIGSAGTAATCQQYAGMFRCYFAHHARLNRTSLSFATKANLVANTMGQNIAALAQGLTMWPTLVGFDDRAHIMSFDPIGGSTDVRYFSAMGSGQGGALTTLRCLYRRLGGDVMPRETAIELAVEALYHSAMDQAGSAVPSITRDIVPNLIGIEATGSYRVPKDVVQEIVPRIEQRYGDT